MVDTNTPPQHLQFNFLIDFPFGRGKRWLGKCQQAFERSGGRLAAWPAREDFTVTDFAITNTNWGPTHPLKKYKKSVPITDCISGTCLKEYEWFNGYIAPTAIAGVRRSMAIPMAAREPRPKSSLASPPVGCPTKRPWTSPAPRIRRGCRSAHRQVLRRPMTLPSAGLPDSHIRGEAAGEWHCHWIWHRPQQQ